MRRVAIYARVSTSEQSTDVQTAALTKYAQDRGFEVAGVYNDAGVSGAVDSRPELNRLMEDSRRRKFDAVLVFRFDRFARSTQHLLRALEEFRALGIDFISYSEAVDTTTPVGKMVFTFLGAVAEFERELIRERVIAGVRRAKEKGKTLGRRRLDVDEGRVRALRAEGKSVREIAKLIGCSKSKAAEVVKDCVQGVQNASRNSPDPSGSGPGRPGAEEAVQKSCCETGER